MEVVEEVVVMKMAFLIEGGRGRAVS